VNSIATNVRQLYDEPAAMPDGALVRAAREGQGWAQEALFKRFAPIAIGQAWRLIPSDDPEDLAQEALVHALVNLHKLSEPQAFAAWLSSIVVRLVMSRLRRRRAFERIGLRRVAEIDADAMTSGVAGEARLELREVYAVLSRLAPEERIALVLRRVEGLELKEVATKMGLSLATVKRRIAVAEEQLSSLKGGV
jgi:RNA polymerase sigma-70 factor (ECF subfamily)